jgi:AcrR family transcriptional regulator
MRSDAKKNYDLVLSVAREVFAEHGAEASLRDVARKAGVGLGTLYRHFPTREALFDAMLRESFDTLTERAIELETAKDTGAALVSWLREIVAVAHSQRGVIALMVAAIAAPDSALHASRCAHPARACCPVRKLPAWQRPTSMARTCSRW